MTSFESTLADLVKGRAESRSEPQWLSGLRRGGQKTFLERGLPTGKDESWRFTPVRPITTVDFEAADTPGIDVRGATSNGVMVRSISEVAKAEPARLEGVLGRIAENRHFTALSSAMFDDGVVVEIAANAENDAPIELVFETPAGGSPRVSYPRVVVIAGEGSSATLVERHSGAGEVPHLVNAVVEVSLGKNAAVEHVRIHDGWQHARTVETIAVRQSRDSRYRSRVFSFGGALARLDLHVSLTEPGAECALDGLYVVRGHSHVDHQTTVRHLARHCSSRQKYKGVLDEVARAVFDGTVIVARDAQQTDAHQENRNLLLSNEAIVNTKPHLEIDADDVRCSHGATVGRLDESQVFYLRARGIGEEPARALLTYGFAHEMVERLGHEELRQTLTRMLFERLPGGDQLEGS